MQMQVCSSMKFTGGNSLLKDVVCSFDVLFVLFVLYAASVSICVSYSLHGVNISIFYLKSSSDTE